MENNNKNEFLKRIRDREKLERKNRRERIFNLSRVFLGFNDETNEIHPQHIEEICKKIKLKNKAEEEDFKILKKGLILHQKNINAFFSIDGVLQGLVRELTGHHVDLQLESAYCLCNLSLGTPKQTLKIAKASSAYLITHLDSLNWPLVDACVWTLGNLCGSDIRVWRIIHEQGFFNKLLQLLEHSCQDILISSIYALNHFINIGIEHLRNEDLSLLVPKICKLFHNKFDVSLSLFLLSSNMNLDDLIISNNDQSVIPSIVQQIASTTISIKTITLYIRCLANWTSSSTGIAAKQFLEETYRIDHIWDHLVTYCSSNSYLAKEILWLLGNIFTHDIPEISDFFINEILQKQQTLLQTIIIQENY